MKTPNKRIVYLANFEFGLPHLAEIEVGDETPHCYTHCRLLQDGLHDLAKFYYIPGRMLRNRGNFVFDSEKEALEWLLSKTQELESRTVEQNLKLKKIYNKFVSSE